MLLTVKQVQEKLNVSNALVYRLIEKGEIASHRIGSSIRISEEDLQDYLERTKRGRSGVILRNNNNVQLNNLHIPD